MPFESELPRARRLLIAAVAAWMTLCPGTPGGNPDAGPALRAVLDSGGGGASASGSTLSAGWLGGSFQSGAARGNGYRLEAGWIGPVGRGEAGERGDFNGDGAVDFSDFLLFARAYGALVGDEEYDPPFDMDGDGSVDFADFLAFAAVYGGHSPKGARVTRTGFGRP